MALCHLKDQDDDLEKKDAHRHGTDNRWPSMYFTWYLEATLFTRLNPKKWLPVLVSGTKNSRTSSLSSAYVPRFHGDDMIAL